MATAIAKNACARERAFTQPPRKSRFSPPPSLIRARSLRALRRQFAVPGLGWPEFCDRRVSPEAFACQSVFGAAWRECAARQRVCIAVGYLRRVASNLALAFAVDRAPQVWYSRHPQNGDSRFVSLLRNRWTVWPPHRSQSGPKMRPPDRVIRRSVRSFAAAVWTAASRLLCDQFISAIGAGTYGVGIAIGALA